MNGNRVGQDEAAVILRISDRIARITFNRAKALNAIDVRLAQEFLAACRAIAENPEVRIVVLCAAGRSFMAGGDLRAFREDGAAAADALIVPLHEGLRILAQLDAPSVAVLQGAVAGAGVGIALSTDLAIAADDTVFNLAYAKVAASLDGGSSWALPRIVGLRKAFELALLADNVPATEALRLSLVNRIVPLAELQAESERLVQRLAAGPTRAYGQIRALLRRSFEHDFQEQLDREHAAFNVCARTRDFAEGIDAFFARRTPRYSGG